MAVGTRRTPAKETTKATTTAAAGGRVHERFGRDALIETVGAVVISIACVWTQRDAGYPFNDLWVFGAGLVLCATLGFLIPAVLLQWMSTLGWADAYGITYSKVCDFFSSISARIDTSSYNAASAHAVHLMPISGQQYRSRLSVLAVSNNKA